MSPIENKELRWKIRHEKAERDKRINRRQTRHQKEGNCLWYAALAAISIIVLAALAAAAGSLFPDLAAIGLWVFEAIFG